MSVKGISHGSCSSCHGFGGLTHGVVGGVIRHKTKKRGGKGVNNPKTMAGLLKWGKEHPTKDIKKIYEEKGFESPGGLAVWVRKQAIGSRTFVRHWKQAMRKRGAKVK